MIRLTRLTINRFRNVKPGTDMRFGPTFNVLLGKNATGKTTLLDLIAAVTNFDFSPYDKDNGDLDLTWWLGEGDTQVEIHATRARAFRMGEWKLGDDWDLDDACTIVLRHAGQEAGRFELKDSRGVWRPEHGPEIAFEKVPSLLMAVFYTIQSSRATTLAHFLAKSIHRFDESTGTFSVIIQQSLEVSRAPNRADVTHGVLMPMDFARQKSPIDWPDVLTFPFEEHPVVAEIPKILGFSSAVLTPRLLKESRDNGAQRRQYQGFDFMFRRADGSQVSHELLSFGQKRLFSFLWYLASLGAKPVVADELFNGLHYEWVELCIDRLEGRQSFLATQDPFLLDHIPVESKEAVRTTFVRCSLEHDESGREQMVWRNFTEEEAERFFVAYETGVQHVSEVLRSEGLW